MKKIDIKSYDVYEIRKTELIEVNGGSIFEDIGFAMGVLLYEDIKLGSSGYDTMVNAWAR